MTRIHGFTAPTARTLQHLANKAGLPQRGQPLPRYPRVLPQQTAIYLIDLLETLPAISTDANGRVILGEASARLLRRASDSPYLPLELIAHPSSQQQDVEVTVYNASETEFEPHPSGTISPPWLAVQDMFGDLYIVAPAAEAGIPFRNDSGYPIPPHGILAVEDSADIGGTSYLLAQRPAATFARQWLVNGATTVAVDETSRGTWLSESGPAAVSDVDSLDAGSGWGPKPGSFLLHRDYLGFTLLGTNTREVDGQLVTDARQHAIVDVLGILYDQLAQGSTALFEIWIRKANNLQPAGFDKITVHDFFMNQGEPAIEARTAAKALWYGDHWEIDNAYCTKSNRDEVLAQSPGAGQGSLGANDLAQQLSQTASSAPTAGLPFTG